MSTRNSVRFVPRPVAHSVAGRGSFGVSLLMGLTLMTLLWMAGCTPVQGNREVLPEPPAIPLDEGQPGGGAEREALEWTREAERLLVLGEWQAAAEQASRVVENHPTTRASGFALWVRAQALGRVEAGSQQATALADLQRLIPLLDGSQGILVRARLLQGRLLVEQGDLTEGIRAALALPGGASVNTRDLGWIRDWSARMEVEELEAAVQGIDPTQPLAAPAFSALAVKLGEQGRADAARQAAQQALSGGAMGPDRQAAEAVMAGVGIAEDPTVANRIPLAAILPSSGSPGLQRFSTALQEGIQSAIQASGLTGQTELEIYDDGGDPFAAANLIRSAEGARAFGVIGPVQDQSFSQAASARSGTLPMISPTAYSLPSGQPGVYSLGSLDPGAAAEMAEWAAAAGIRTVAIVHAAEEGSIEESRIFEETFSAGGGQVVRRFSYTPGATFFEEQIQGAAALRPDAILFPVPAQDVEALAPQVTFFGIDTLGIQILGTDGWTDEQVRERVQGRNLSGVVTSSTDLTSTEGYDRFRQGYEERFQRTLRDDGSAALGYDAAALLLEAASSGARSAAELARALEQIEDFPGATGRLTVQDGRIVRAHRILCYAGAQTVAIPAERPVQVYRQRQPDPETDSIPPGPGLRSGFACPGTPEAARAHAYLDSIAGVGGAPRPAQRTEASPAIAPLLTAEPAIAPLRPAEPAKPSPDVEAGPPEPPKTHG